MVEKRHLGAACPGRPVPCPQAPEAPPGGDGHTILPLALWPSLHGEERRGHRWAPLGRRGPATSHPTLSPGAEPPAPPRPSRPAVRRGCRSPPTRHGAGAAVGPAGAAVLGDVLVPGDTGVVDPIHISPVPALGQVRRGQVLMRPRVCPGKRPERAESASAPLPQNDRPRRVRARIPRGAPLPGGTPAPRMRRRQRTPTCRNHTAPPSPSPQAPPALQVRLVPPSKGREKERTPQNTGAGFDPQRSREAGRQVPGSPGSPGWGAAPHAAHLRPSLASWSPRRGLWQLWPARK